MTEVVVWAWRDGEGGIIARERDDFTPRTGMVEVFKGDALWPLLAELPDDMADDTAVRIKVRITRAR